MTPKLSLHVAGTLDRAKPGSQDSQLRLRVKLGGDVCETVQFRCHPDSVPDLPQPGQPIVLEVPMALRSKEYGGGYAPDGAARVLKPRGTSAAAGQSLKEAA